MFRAVMPEATITLNGSVYTVGGLENGGTDYNNATHFLAYANRSELSFQSQTDRTLSLYNAVGNFEFLNYTSGLLSAPFKWSSGSRGSPKELNWSVSMTLARSHTHAHTRTRTRTHAHMHAHTHIRTYARPLYRSVHYTGPLT